MEKREQDRIVAEEMGKLADLLRREGYEVHEIRVGHPYMSDGYVGMALSVNIIKYSRGDTKD
jgi:hypothetical protein